ncbi:ParA family protein [Hyphobacterium sp. Y6023]|uniref:ParA family protein n=1 Tax=Hyphobacterium marinum TaxID=3116574 RepID=A0ABU7LYI5_9PROT|nr:ParA family protein [Hyphobacterium sp. Y6023]MEE2566604.1 ParA family protein [Hyphobacterium sp. Y6023]
MADQSAVLVFASQKGGSGKTTLSGHIAVEAERAGDGPVALIDTDPQGSLAKWWNERSAARPAFARVAISQLGPGIEHLQRNGFRLIVIDTPPAVTESIRQVVAHADLVVAPTRPSPHDLRAVGPTVDIADAYRKALLFVVNSATARARITGETAVALSQHGVVAPVTIHHRVDFAAAMIDGRTASEVRPESRSAQEISTLWTYMKGQLARIKGPQSGWQPVRDLTTSLLSPALAEDQFDDDAGEDDLDPALLVDSVLPDQSPTGSGGALPPIEIPSPFQSGARPAFTPRQPANGNWDGIDRRKSDTGPPPGMPERRRVFGRRTASTH